MKSTTDPWGQFEIDPEGFKQIDFSQRLVSPRPEIPQILYSPPLLPHPELNSDALCIPIFHATTD
jgi:hypothetical protein